VYGCWSQDETISSWMVEEGLNSYDDVYNYFFQRVLDEIGDMEVNVKLVWWEEGFESNAQSLLSDDQNHVFQAWKNETAIQPITSAGLIINCLI